MLHTCTDPECKHSSPNNIGTTGKVGFKCLRRFLLGCLLTVHRACCDQINNLTFENQIAQIEYRMPGKQ